MPGEFHIAVGLPGSGKSTGIQALKMLGQIDVIVSPDEIRWKRIAKDGTSEDPYFDPTIEGYVWNEAYRLIHRALRQDKRVMLDATNLKKADRQKAKKAAIRLKSKAIAHLFEVPFEECFKRNLARERTVPYDTMMRMRSEYLSQCKRSQIEADGFEVIVYKTWEGGD